MRIREIFIKQVRVFQDERRISFADPISGSTPPLTVLAGSNGSGKTTLLEAIHDTLNFAINDITTPLIQEVLDHGLLSLIIDFSPDEIELIQKITPPEGQALVTMPEPSIKISIGNPAFKNHAAVSDQGVGHSYSFFFSGSRGNPPSKTRDAGRFSLITLRKSPGSPGGVIYFPYDRQLRKQNGGGGIEPPSDEIEWVFKYTTPSDWKGSLEQLWVWQNYLDLEQKGNGKNLAPFIKTIENALGPNRKIWISQGRVLVETGWQQPNGEPGVVQLGQLPSGEQQVLLILGEIARRIRKHSIVLIDEVENSLHPTLQRLLMWNLKKLAADFQAQIIVTTHSAEIIHTVRGSSFTNLDYPENRFDLEIPEDKEASE